MQFERRNRTGAPGQLILGASLLDYSLATLCRRKIDATLKRFWAGSA